MKTCMPFSWPQRLVIALMSASLSLTIVGSLLLLFNDGRIPGAEVYVVAASSSAR